VISLSTLAFALASLAAFAAAGALLTCFRLARDMDSQKLSSAQALRLHSANIERAKQVISARLAELDRRSPAKDAAEVAALREAVDSLKQTHQRFAGKFYQQYREADPSSSSAPQSSLPLNGLDPELAAELALQSAPPVRPGA
jgi:uncharacterized protein YhaN